MTSTYIPLSNLPEDKQQNHPQFLSRTPSTFRNTLRYIRGSWTWYWTSHLLGLLWLAPIITLLVLNFENKIIGPSAWCPFGKCYDNAFDEPLPTGIKSQDELDLRDRNLLGALQFVAKAKELWFAFIATSLVFDVVMRLAKSSQGLPIGFLLTHLQFSDLSNLVNPLLWTSAQAPSSARTRSKRIRLYLFVAFAVFLTILTNLMGPSTAALLIPALQWVRVVSKNEEQFQAISSGQPPSGDDVFPGACTAANLSASQFACTAPVHAPNLDSIAAFIDSGYNDFLNPGAILIPPIQEDSVTFAFNLSNQAGIVWAPNRQVLRNISTDFIQFINTVTGKNATLGPGVGSNIAPSDEQLPVLNRSLSTSIQREGPSIGISPISTFGSGNLLEISMSAPLETRQCAA